ncbi:hypothetical protein EJ08DRAFT_699464 [Tothia fuscella]|uniref:Programmed cell death protein 2 C-terminal domain-containing protein n=1 Tax=Tothia fuscella TaxID=1048955 RepID=A0A9P4NMK2_9PEZI|nr:hypothetical protein EJ08DRAFT_699464 [Tothia fuscella]
MPPYDSDSSGGEDGDYTETSVLLGYSSKEPTGDTFSQLGGHPTWLDRETTPSGSLVKCKVCNGLLTLLLQLNGDLPDRFPGHERRLYIFSCRRKACRRKDGSIRGIIGNRVTKPKAVQQDKVPAPIGSAPQTNIGAALFGGGAPGSSLGNSCTSSSTSNPFAFPTASNPFSANPFAGVSTLAAKPAQRPDTSVAGLPETFASKARITESSSPTDSAFKPVSTSCPHEPWPSASDFPPPYPTSHLDADYETLSAPSTPQLPTVNSDMDTDMGGSSTGGAEESQLFESTMDKTFQKFADRLAQNPEQVLRYEFGGQPLLYSTTDAVGKLLSPAPGTKGKVTTFSNGSSKLPRCSNCGADRVCEMQLTPHAITVLEDEELGLDGMDWGTVILGACSKDCVAFGTSEGDVAYLEEWVGVQWEELEERRKK